MKRMFFFVEVILISSLLTFCGEKPTEPKRDNPFDPANPQTGGDPFELTVKIANGGVMLNWNKPIFPDIKQYKIYRSEEKSTGYLELATTENEQTQYVDKSIENGHSYWYVVAAMNSAGKENDRTNVEPVNIKTQPVLVINGGAHFTLAREVQLTILAAKATQMMLSNNSDFAGTDWEDYATSKNWILSTGEGEKTVYMKVKYEDGMESPTVMAKIKPQPIEPSIAIIADTVKYAPSRNVLIRVKASGTNLQMKLSEDSTFKNVDWMIYEATPSYILSAGNGIKKVFAIIKNDFGIESKIVSDDIIPQPINPDIIIANGAGFCQSRNVELNLIASGDNLQLKLNDEPTFDGIEWQDYEPILNYRLSDGEGTKTLYVKFKNDFEIESSVVSDNIILDLTAPHAVLSVLPDSGITNETQFQIDPTGSSDNLTPKGDLQVRFDWDNDGSFDTEWAYLSVSNYTYSVGGGNKVINMQLKDGAGWQVDTTSNLFVNTRPQPEFQSSEDKKNPLRWFFDASASKDYEDGTDIEYRWDFNGDQIWDTEWLTQDTISYTYSGGEIYDVLLSVRDRNLLANEISQQIILNPTSLTDIDGNVYKVIKIGEQYWMAENLRVTRYRNGDYINKIESNTEWSNTSDGAFCEYGDNDLDVLTYGLLYNWYAVVDPRNIAPEGWHVPTDLEWRELELYLGMREIDADTIGYRGAPFGNKLKMESGWLENGNGNNESGFSALPAGIRYYWDGVFGYRGYTTYWWSTSSPSSSSAFSRSLKHDYSGIGREESPKRNGYSVRLVRD